MSYDETIAMLKNLRSLIFAGGGDDSALSATQKGWITKTYKAETGKAIRDCKCRNRYTDAVDELLHLLKARGKTADEARYTLKDGVLIWLGNECYSRHNLTDEVAEEWLQLHPDGQDKFEKIA